METILNQGVGVCLLSFWKGHELFIRKSRPVLCSSLLFWTHSMSFNEILHIMAGKCAFPLKLHKVSPCSCSRQLTAGVQQPQKLTQVWQIEVLKYGGNKTETPGMGSDKTLLSATDCKRHKRLMLISAGFSKSSAAKSGTSWQVSVFLCHAPEVTLTHCH